ncbi:uncharacterized protein LOC113313135 isoform X3 [Papaver somniferum]|uniref:uncharacterized protein LOC113313135 isoform X3 n=1 Tax=Papaver somniferum TaxID=3469 RepID=UPI000E706041|nr:uncharacterized protein LOC113313135 isoform X3 [Papaver somniferum]
MFDLYDHQTQRFKFHVLDLKGFVHFRQTVRFVKKLAKLFDARNCCELKSSWLETFGVMEKIGRKKTKKHSLSNREISDSNLRGQLPLSIQFAGNTKSRAT